MCTVWGVAASAETWCPLLTTAMPSHQARMCAAFDFCTLHSGYLHCIVYMWFSCSSGLSWRLPVVDHNCLLLLLCLFLYWPTGWCFSVPILRVKGRLTLCYRLCCDKLPYCFHTFLNTPVLHAELIFTDDSTCHVWHSWPNVPCSFIRRETIFWCSCGSPFVKWWLLLRCVNKFLICVESNKTNRLFTWWPANIRVNRLCTGHKLCFVWGVSRGQRNSSPSEHNNCKSVTKIQQICEEYYILQTCPVLLEMLMWGTQKICFVKFWASADELYRCLLCCAVLCCVQGHRANNQCSGVQHVVH